MRQKTWFASVVVFAVAVLAAAWMWFLPRHDKSAATTSVPNRDASTVWLEDITVGSGLDFTYERGQKIRYWLPEIMGGGAAWFDYDRDGDLDLYLVQGGQINPPDVDSIPGNRLYRNRGDGTFEDVTDLSGVGDRGYGMGCVCGDYDDDGDVDLYVTNVGSNVLYRNNADGTFTDATSSAGVGDTGWGTSGAFIDYDADGDLDLFVANYVDWSAEREQVCLSGTREDYCTPKTYDAPAPDMLYRNEGDGTFTDVCESAGLRGAFGNGLGVACGDFDLDGRVDIYVANDGTPNQLWINDGEGHFTDEALLSGCAVNMYGTAEAGMGMAAVDVENDGDLDLFMTHLREESNTFYLNQNGMFEDTTPMTGLSTSSIPFTGFGMGFADFDHDGALDLYVANGRVGYYEPLFSPTNSYGEPNQLFRGLGDGRFEEVLPRGGTQEELIGASRAAAFADYDNDGDIDVLVVNSGSPARLYRNLTPDQDNWIMFRLLEASQRDAYGAMVSVESAGKVQWRLAHPAYSYCASNDPRVHFGLGESTSADQVTVRWPNGVVEQFGPFAAGQHYELRQGSGSSVDQ